MRVRNNKDHQITVSKSRKGISQIFDVQATEQDWRVGDAASQRSYDFVLSWELRDVEIVCFIFGSPESNGQAEVERNEPGPIDSETVLVCSFSRRSREGSG